MRISTNSYSYNKFDLPFEMIQPIKQIAVALEHVIVKYINAGQKQLTKSKIKKAKKKRIKIIK